MTKKLIALRLLSVLSSIAAGKKKGKEASYSKSRLIGFLLIYVYLAGTFAFLSSTIAYSLGSVFIPLGLESLYFGLFMTATVTIVFVLSIFETKSELFESKDNELLLSMPIKPRSIVLSRIFTVLVYNYIETLIIMLPAIVVYAICGGSITGIFGASAVTLLLPLLATSLASGVGYLVALLTKRMKNKSFFVTAVYLAFMAVYFIGYDALMKGINNLAEASDEFALELAKSLGFFDAFGSAALFEPMNFTLFAVVSVGVAIAAYIVISHHYVSIVTGGGSSSRVTYRERKLKKRSAFYALAMKEIRGFISSPLYMLNSGLGVIFCIVLGIMALVKREELITMLPIITVLFEGIGDANAFVYAMIPVAVIFVMSMVYISTPALSLEGKRLWIVKSMPVSAKTLLYAKLVPHLLFSIPSVIVGSVLFTVAFEPGLEYLPFIIITPIVGSVFSALFGGVVGSVFCKFDYQSEVRVIKQSAASTVSLFGMMLLSVGFAALTIWLSIVLSPLAASFVLLGLLVCLSAVCLWLLSGIIARKLDRVEV